MDKADILEIKEIFREEIKPLGQKIDRLRNDVNQIHQTVYGVEGTNGMVQTVKTLEKDVSGLKRFRTAISSIVTAVTTGLGLWIRTKG